MLRTEAPAKINWALEVLGRRPDGYHDIRSVMSTLSLADEITLEPAPAWSITIDAPEPLRSELEAGDNLVRRAVWELAAELTGGRGQAAPAASWPRADLPGPPAHLHLSKRIPAAAGLGGGSSDAAATLRLLAAYWKLPEVLGLGPEAVVDLVERVAARIGSDVPFFVRGGTHLVRGRGELLDPLRDPPAAWVVLLTPSIAVERKTARVYAALDPACFTDGSRSEALARRLDAGRRITERDLFNAFEGAASSVFPDIARYRSALESASDRPAHLCGAGPSLFAPCSDEHSARAAAERLRAEGMTAWAASTS